MAHYDPHAAEYDLWAADMVDDVEWYVSLAREAAAPIVELAVGTGRVAIPIARETGKRVIGIDRSPAMWPASVRPASASSCARATCSISPSRSRSS